MKRMACARLPTAAVSVISKQSRRGAMPVASSSSQHVVEEGLVAQRLAREVDGEAGVVAVRTRARQARATKAAWTTQRSIERDQVVALGGGDEGAGRGDAAVLVDHADEDLAERRLVAAGASGWMRCW